MKKTILLSIILLFFITNSYAQVGFIRTIKPTYKIKKGRENIINNTFNENNSNNNTSVDNPENNTTSEKPKDSSTKNNPQNVSAELTIPNLGSQSINIIPTPTYSYIVPVTKFNKFTFSGNVYGNSLSSDSSFNKLGSKMLIPQASSFAIHTGSDYFIDKVMWDVLYNDISSLLSKAKDEDKKKKNDDRKKKNDEIRKNSVLNENFKLAIHSEINFLYKKVGFYDTAQKINTNFTPLVIHYKLGLNAAIFQWLFLSYNYNMLTCQTETDNYNSFFNNASTGKIEYNDFSLALLVGLNKDNASNIKANKQLLKVELFSIFTNTDTHHFYISNDNMIPYLKFSLISSL